MSDRMKKKSAASKDKSSDANKRRHQEASACHDSTLGLSPVKISRNRDVKFDGDRISFDMDMSYGLSEKENVSMESILSRPSCSKEEFRKVAETSTSFMNESLKHLPVLECSPKENMTYRRPDESFDGFNISDYFGKKSEPFDKDVFNASSAMNDTFKMNVSCADFLRSSEESLLLTKKKIEATRAKNKTQKTKILNDTSMFESDSILNCSLRNFVPSADSTHIDSDECRSSSSGKSSASSSTCSAKSIKSRTSPTPQLPLQVSPCEDIALVVSPSTIKLSHPVFLTHVIDYLEVHNPTPYMFRSVIKFSSYDSSSLEIQNLVQEISTPPFFTGSLGAKIHITPLTTVTKPIFIEVHSQLLASNNLMFVKPVTICCDIQSEYAILQHVATVGERRAVHAVELNFIKPPEVHWLDYRFDSQFDADIPLRFTIRSDSDIVRFPIGQALTQRRESHRSPDSRTLITVVKENQFNIPVVFNILPKKKLESFAFEIAASLDSQSYPHTVNITKFKVHVWPRGNLGHKALQASPSRLNLELSAWCEICFRNKSPNQAIEVKLAVASAASKVDPDKIKFRSERFVIAPLGKYTNGLYVTTVLPSDCFILATSSAGDESEAAITRIPITDLVIFLDYDLRIIFHLYFISI
ncbi:hypothetical protein HDE_09992 [Halotydeus destructor]|nr:hypothetical protein HDE_09992 [Halotydeus destructor]